MAGQPDVDGRCVCIVHAVVDRPDQGCVVHEPRQAGQVLADRDAGEARVNRPELSADLRGCVRLHVPHIEVARPAIEEQNDASVGTRRQPGAVRLRLGPQQAGQAQPHKCRASPPGASRGVRVREGPGHRGKSLKAELLNRGRRNAAQWRIDPERQRSFAPACLVELGIEDSDLVTPVQRGSGVALG